MTDRIRPFYEVPNDLEDTVLLESPSAVLSQNGKEYSGRFQVIHSWRSTYSTMRFWPANLSDEGLELGMATVTPQGMSPIAMHVMTRGGLSASGTIGEYVDVGTDHKLASVTFHLANFANNAVGGDPQYIEDEWGQKTYQAGPQMVLQHDGWKITLEPFENICDLTSSNFHDGYARLTYVGEIRRLDGSEFKRKLVQPLLESLRAFLSFARAEWTPLLFVVGSNSVNPKTWQRISHYSASAHWHSQGWLEEEHSECLSLAYPGFCKLWSRERWRVPITQAVSWLVQAAKSEHNLEGAIAFCQIPLEMLAWLVFVDNETVIDSEGFDRLSAANKFQLLLHHCQIPLAIPNQLDVLQVIAKDGKQSTMTGPQIITEIRNTIVHPNERNRQKLEGWMTSKQLDRERVLRHTLELFRHYITLVLLRFMEYHGDYANRLMFRGPCPLTKVPWATS